MKHIRLFALAACPFLASPCPAGEADATITYQGRLDNNGAPFDGVVDLSFSLYSEAIGGVLLAGPIDFPGAAVSGGLFTVELPIDTVGLPKDGYWIQILADGTSLTPRQAYRPAAGSVQSAGAEIAGPGNVVLSRRLGATRTAFSSGSTNANPALPSLWQSFTPTTSGVLAEITVLGALAIGDEITFRVYEGAGLGGSLLFTGAGKDGRTQFDLYAIDGPELTAGQLYTFEVLITDSATQLPGGATWPIFSLSNPYPGGRASTGAKDDSYFDVWVESEGAAAVQVINRKSFDIEGQLRVTGSDDTLVDDVDLPAGSIDSTEIANEPGVASISTGFQQIEFPSLFLLASRDITVPASGYVLASFNADLTIYNHVSGIRSSIVIGLSGEPDALPTSLSFNATVPPGWPSGSFRWPFSAQGLFYAPEPGTYRIYTLKQREPDTGADGTILNGSMILLYLPTVYGETSALVELSPLAAPVSDGAVTLKPIGRGDD